MESAQRKAIEAHRRRQKARGMVRVEVQAPEGDVPLIRTLAAVLREDPDMASRVRAQLRWALQPPATQNLLEMLACDLPDNVVEEALERPRDFGREMRL